MTSPKSPRWERGKWGICKKAEWMVTSHCHLGFLWGVSPINRWLLCKNAIVSSSTVHAVGWVCQDSRLCAFSRGGLTWVTSGGQQQESVSPKSRCEVTLGLAVGSQPVGRTCRQLRRDTRGGGRGGLPYIAGRRGHLEAAPPPHPEALADIWPATLPMTPSQSRPNKSLLNS